MDPEWAIEFLHNVGHVDVLDYVGGGLPEEPEFRAKVSFDLSKPLIPGCFVPCVGGGQYVWVFVRYEGVFKFCNKCGLVGHYTRNCLSTSYQAYTNIMTRMERLHASGLTVFHDPMTAPLYTNMIKGSLDKYQFRNVRINLSLPGLNVEGVDNDGHEFKLGRSDNNNDDGNDGDVSSDNSGESDGDVGGQNNQNDMHKIRDIHVNLVDQWKEEERIPRDSGSANEGGGISNGFVPHRYRDVKPHIGEEYGLAYECSGACNHLSNESAVGEGGNSNGVEQDIVMGLEVEESDPLTTFISCLGTWKCVT